MPILPKDDINDKLLEELTIKYLRDQGMDYTDRELIEGMKKTMYIQANLFNHNVGRLGSLAYDIISSDLQRLSDNLDKALQGIKKFILFNIK